MTASSGPSRGLIIAAFVSVYVIWGSTYLAIRYAVADVPPFLMAGARWILAGVALYLWRRLVAKDERPRLEHWRAAAIVGALLIVGGNGTVSWAEQLVPSGLTALLIAIVPVWIALLMWATAGARPTGRVALGIGLGVAGVGFLVGPQALAGGPILGIACILAASIGWASGSIYARKAKLPSSPLLGASMEMLVGGALLTVIGLAQGELPRVHLASIGWPAWVSFAFLVTFGSIVAYSAYVWLLQVVRPELVATYAFVNPIVAVILAAAIAKESFGALTVVAAALIVVAVAIVVTAPKEPKKGTSALAHPTER